MTQKFIITFIVIMLAAIFIWTMGPVIAIAGHIPLASEQNRIIAILVMAMIWSLFNLSSSDDDLKTDNDDLSDALDKLEKKFKGAIKFLQTTYINKNHQKKQLLQLPWFLVIGNTDSGKSTLLANNGLKYVLAKQSIKDNLEIDKTRDCEWWVTKDAVLLDTSGQYVNCDNKTANFKIWQKLLKLIKKFNVEHSIDGIIVNISIADLQDHKKLPRKIRNRIRDVRKNLGYELPIYIIFTKMDSIAGFHNFFNDMDSEERSQVWGFQIENASQCSKNFNHNFNKSYRQLLDALHQRLIWRMHQEHNLAKREQIKDFPAQIESLQNLIRRSIDQIVDGHDHQLIQGVFFTSATQPEQQKTTDRLLAPISRSFQVSTEVSHSSAAYESNAYFCQQLFQNLPSSLNIKTKNNKKAYVRPNPWLQRSAIAASIFAIVALSSYFIRDYKSEVAIAHNAEQAITQYQVLSNTLSPQTMAFNQTLPALNALQSAIIQIQQLDSQDKLHKHLHQNNALLQSLTQTYSQALQQFFLPSLANELEAQINSNNTQLAFGSLRTYLMLSKPQQLDKQYVTSWLSGYWKQAFAGQPQTQQQLLSHLQAAINQPMIPITLNPQVLLQARKILNITGTGHATQNRMVIDRSQG